jgi:hypothetical protein
MTLENPLLSVIGSSERFIGSIAIVIAVVVLRSSVYFHHYMMSFKAILPCQGTQPTEPMGNYYSVPLKINKVP